MLHDRNRLDFVALRSSNKHSVQGGIVDKAVMKVATRVDMG